MSALSEQLLDSEESDDRTRSNNGISGNSCLSRGLVLEPAAMLLFFAIDLSGIIIQSEIIYLTCSQTYGFNKSDCRMLVSGGETDVTKKSRTIITFQEIELENSHWLCILPNIGKSTHATGKIMGTGIRVHVGFSGIPERIWPALATISIEQELSLIILYLDLSESITRFTEKKTGKVTFYHCSIEIETNIEPYVANILMVRSIIGGLIPVIGALFAGGWSDRFGRKPIILSAYIGYFLVHLFCAILAFLSVIYPVSPWLYIPMTMPAAILSANCSLKSGAFAYIADVTDERSRTYRMAIYETSLYIGIVVGYWMSGPVFRATNAHSVFSISAGVIFVALLLIWFGLKESVNIDEIDESSSSRGLFNWSLLRDLKETVFMRRGDYELTKLWLIITMLALHVFVFDGSENVSFLFVREKFGWTVSDFTTYEASQKMFQIFGNVVAVAFLQKLLKMSATSIALLSYGSCVLEAVIKGTAKYPWEMYLAGGVGSMRVVAVPMCQLILSLFIPNTEIGKVYSFVSAIQALTPLASAPFYSELYARTLTIDSRIFNLVSAGIYVICFILMTIVFWLTPIHRIVI